MIRFAAALAVLAGAMAVVAPLAVSGEVFPDTVWARGLTFYLVTAGAYALLPYMRRGDIAMVAMWLVLAVGVAPCFVGQELSAVHMFSDMGGVAAAVIPIYIARFRQVAQGDMRPYRRREAELAP
jgi:heme/copper-type cytochrome/quinol oxidase subunit 3